MSGLGVLGGPEAGGDVVCGRALLAAQPQGGRGFLHAGLAPGAWGPAGCSGWMQGRFQQDVALLPRALYGPFVRDRLQARG